MTLTNVMTLYLVRIVLLCPKLKSLICKYMILVHQVDLVVIQ